MKSGAPLLGLAKSVYYFYLMEFNPGQILSKFTKLMETIIIIVPCIALTNTVIQSLTVKVLNK